MPRVIQDQFSKGDGKKEMPVTDNVQREQISLLFNVVDRVKARIDETWLTTTDEATRTLLSDCHMVLSALQSKVEI